MKISSNIKTAIIAASALTMTAMAAPASAGVVTFQTSGQWTNWSGGANVSVSNGSGGATGDSKIYWGKYSSAKSGYEFDAKNAGAFSLADGGATNAFTLADFKHVNEKITGNGIKSVDLVFNTKIFVDGDYVTDRSYTWTFKHDETSDTFLTFLCPYGGAGTGCDDKVSVAGSGNFGDTFQVGNDLYTFNLSGFQMKNGANYVDTNSFLTREDKTSMGYIRGQLSMTTLTSAVPEPSTWAMMIVGFFGAGSMIRSTRRKGLMAVAA